jgi:3-dehydroquinate synthase
MNRINTKQHERHDHHQKSIYPVDFMEYESDPLNSGQGRFPHDCYEQRFTVSYDYPVYFTKNLFHPRNDLLASVIDRLNEHRRHRLIVFLDSGVSEAAPGFEKTIQHYFEKWSDCVKMEGRVEIIPGGEKIKKGWDLVKPIMTKIAESHLCRQSYVVAIGGGSVLDVVGFAASTVHRGLRLIRIPSTVLAQDDAGVGVKNGINEHGMKNFAGTFAPPFAVMIDYQLLQTLQTKYWLGGVAEAFKVAIIKDSNFFEYLCRHAAKLRQKDATVIEETVKRCAILHLKHIGTNGDPFEFGTARPLDFGHWSAHRLEALSGYQIGHGQAVSIGIAMDSFYASQIGLLSDKECNTIIDALDETGLPIWSDLLEQRRSDGRLEILQGLDDFQEHLGGRLTVTLPNGIGRKVEIHDMDSTIIERAISYLKQRSTNVVFPE